MNYLEIFGLIVGLIYLWLEYRASIYLWAASIIMPAINLKVYFDAGLYADFGIDIYYLLIAIYGYFAWRYGLGKAKKEKREALQVSHTPLRQIPILIAVLLLLWAAISFVLIRFTDSTVPYADAFTTATSIVAMWMLARKQAEQWLVWIIVDAVSAALYAYKGLYLYSGLYAIYTVIAYFGYLRWLKLIPTNYND
ncbi:MAG: nicotinamide mononucleotide transporter [Muribaculaceae bacterium]|nr:nicotinamide mononucleotide transporter [Muribaculaceae bacterium]